MPKLRDQIAVKNILEHVAEPLQQASVNTVQTTCPYCGVGCGVLAQVNQGRMIGVRGDPEHPANRGKLCVKGSALHETTGLRGRLLEPRVAGETVNWSRAIDSVVRAIGQSIERHGPDSVAFYVSGQLLTEDYYVANKLMKGFIGAANIDTNSRLCMSSAVVAHKRAFGGDLVSGNYEDIMVADLLLVVGANPAWTHPVLYQRRMAAQAADPHKKMIVIDPRRTVTASEADLHLPLRPGADAFFFLGLAHWLVTNDCVNTDFIEQHCEHFEGFLASLGPWTLQRVSVETDLNIADLQKAYEWFARTARTVTFFSQGINQSSSGVDKGNTIINCHLMMGRIGQLGATPWSITGQPNAMGGREVGGLANQLAAHLSIENPTHRRLVQDFWQSPTIAEKPGLQAVDLFKQMHEGNIKCVWIMATNPMVSLPDRNFVRSALSRCETVIVSDVLDQTDTLALADICLPAAAWGEKSGTVTNSERCISRQRQCVPLPGSAKPDWAIICEVARGLGWERAFDYQHPSQIFREHAALTALLNGAPYSQKTLIPRGLNLAGLMGLAQSEYEALEPTQWPVRVDGKSTVRLFADGQFYTDSGRAQFVVVQPQRPTQNTSDAYPFVVNSGRVRDHWHTMTRSGCAPRLAGHQAEPCAVFHPKDFDLLGLKKQGLVRLRSPFGSILLRPEKDVGQRPGEVFVPIHWNDSVSANATVSQLFAQVVDPLSGQPELKHGVARCEAVETVWQAVVFASWPLQSAWLNSQADYWCRIRAGHGYRYSLMGVNAPPTGRALFNVLIQKMNEHEEGSAHDDAPIVEELIFDQGGGKNFRGGAFSESGLRCGVWLGPDIEVSSGDALSVLFPQDNDVPPRSEFSANLPRSAIVAPAQREEGGLVCSCWRVRRNDINAAIDAGYDTLSALGAQLGCGTGCGTCLPELRTLLASSEANSPVIPDVI